jgi:bifunctional non-homologous end joining protein LigD
LSLREYNRKRRFTDTPEPAAEEATVRARGRGQHRPMFVVQLHNARARHYDFRLEADGALKSWAVPKGPSLRPGDKRLAVQVEDHPLSYATFEGEIPEGNYGAGHVLVFDQGVWASEGDPLQAIAEGKLDFTLEGHKLKGAWKLVRTGMRGGRGGNRPQWLLIKRHDRHARDVDADDLVEVEPGPESSAATGRIWLSNEGERKAAGASGKKKKSPAKAKNASVTARKRVRRSDTTWRRRALALEGARDKPFPAGFKPELATLRENPPRGDDWLHEVKWDGYRMLADLVDGRVKLRSRNNLDWTPDFPEIVEALESLPVSDARFDGELVALTPEGISDFALLQHTLQGSSNASLRYMVFDMPGIAGVDLSRATLLDRKKLLEALLDKAEDAQGPVAYSSHVLGHGEDVFAASATQGLEGILCKSVDAPYTQARSPHWVKVKHAQGDEFVVVGYTAPRGSRTGFGALLLAVPEDGGLRYIGRVGTGYNDEMLRTLHRQLRKLEHKGPTLELPDHLPSDKRDRGNIHWVRPEMVVEVAYRGWGKDGLVRQGSFQRVRVDKGVEDLRMANAKTASKKDAARPPAVDKPARGAKRASKSAQVQISSRDRVVFPDVGVTKGEVADYYAAIADRILTDLANRPISLVRCPDGAEGQCFFQKHHAGTLGAHVHAISLKEKQGKDDYLYIKDAAGLLELVQMNVLEFHPWGAHIDKPEQPDTMVFDLDPGPGIGWKQIVAAAREVRARLQDAGLTSFVRLSGGKGLHVVVPIRRGPSWDEVKDFTGAFAEAMAAHKPLHYVATMSKAKRNDRIFIDWLRNGRGATSVTNWSLRARKGAPVAMPIRWEELGRVKGPAVFDLRTALKRAKTLKQDPWHDYASTKQSLPKMR